MKKKKLFLSIGICMTVFAVIFIMYALTHPTSSISLPLPLLYAIYLVYIIATIVMFVLAVQNEDK